MVGLATLNKARGGRAVAKAAAQASSVVGWRERGAVVSFVVAPPKSIDRYEVLDILGRGAMGSVYRAWDPKLRREVAVKVVAQAATDKARERFYREVCAIAALRHPNIVEIYDHSGTDSEQLYYVMEKLDGQDLFNLLKANGPMPESMVAAAGHELCLALSVAHAAGIIHRDLKPENVFLSAAGRVVLTDFGVVKAVREGSAVEGYNANTEVIGTPGFMAPEVLTSKPLGAFTDLYALGVLLYNMLTGHVPFEGNSPLEMHRAMMAGKYADPRTYDPRISRALCETLAQSLAPKTRERFQSAEAMRQALKAILDAHGVSDLRDDLRAYATDAHTYAESARRRAAAYLVQQLKVAVKDHDRAEVCALQERLGVVDPSNEEALAVSGVFELAGKGRPRGVRPLPQGSGARSPRDTQVDAARVSPGAWRGALAAGGALAAIMVAGAVWLALSRPPGQPPQAREVVAPPVLTAAPAPVVASPPRPSPAEVSDAPAAVAPAPSEAAGGRLVVLLRGGGAAVSLDGERLATSELGGKELAAGAHRLEVGGRRRHLDLRLTVAAGEQVTVFADLRRGTIARLPAGEGALPEPSHGGRADRPHGKAPRRLNP
jgi:eukaryotic-like serine/threonine-protein kinase